MVNKNTFGTEMKIIKYTSSADILVEFQDEHHYVKQARMQNFTKGSIHNPYDKVAFGIGYLGVGKYKSNIKGSQNNPVYINWMNMHKRCYWDQMKEALTYKDCQVCEEWHNFQNYAQWYEDNYYEVPNNRMEIDKDILIKGNKTYSPDTCVFVPQEINLLFVNRKNYRGDTPIGVKNNNGRFSVICGHDNTVTSLGTYDTPEEAFNIFKKYKEQHIKNIADKYKDIIPNKLYKALYKWEVEITD